MRVFIAALSLATVAYAGSLTYANCDVGELGEIIDVSCDQFKDNEYLNLKRGQTYTFTIKFKAGEDSKYLMPEIYGMISGIQVPWQGVPANACGSLTGNYCPLVAGQVYSYSASVDIVAAYPTVSVTFIWSMVSADENANKGNKQICFTMPATIIN